MMILRKHFVGALLLLGVLLTVPVLYSLSAQQAADDLYESALLKKEAEGDLNGAIELFQKLLKTFPQSREVGAKALLQIGICYEKMGRDEAQKAYRQIIDEYAEQQKVVADARARLSAIRGGLTLPGETKLALEGLSFYPTAVSPDGMKLFGIVETTGRNTAVYDISGSRLTQITHFGREKSSWLTIPSASSPDGREIAFTQVPWADPGTGELKAATSDGKVRLLYREEGAMVVAGDWLDDGDVLVAVQKGGRSRLGIVPGRGGEFRLLRELGAEFRGLPDASPDGRFVVYDQSPKGGSPDIFILDIDGKAEERLIDHPAADHTPRWSPDGRHVIFLSDRSGSPALWGVKVENGRTAGPPFLIRDGMDRTSVVGWTKRGFVYTKIVGLIDIYLMPINPETLEPAAPPKPIPYVPSGRNFAPAWSPGGESLAFRSNPADKDFTVVFPLAGGKAREFPMAGTWQNPRWLPDSGGLVLLGYDDEGRLAIHRLELGTGRWTARPLKATSWTSYTPTSDGKAVLYANNTGKDAERGIIEFNLGNGSERCIYRPAQGSEDAIAALALSLDHRRLAFKEGKRLVVLDLDSGKTETVGPDGVSPQSWSPDGRCLLVAAGNNKVLSILSLDDGKIKTIDLAFLFPEGRLSGILGRADWSPDGRTIAFAGSYGKQETLVLRDVVPAEQK